jgi:hypothetical protein
VFSGIFTIKQKMKAKYYLVFLVLIFIVGCEKTEDKSKINASVGKINSLSIIISDQLWNGEIGDSLRKKFAASVDGLPQEEPLFTINQYPIKALDGKIIGRNVIIIKKEEKNDFSIQENEFAAPQTIVHISGNNVIEIVDHIEKNADSIIKKLKQGEIRQSQKIIDTSLLDAQKIRKKFKIDLHLPSNYKYALEKRNFIWLKKEILSGNTSVLIYKVPFKTILKNDDLTNNIIKMRDSIGGLYIRGKQKRNKMITEESYAPYFLNTIINNRRAYETKGTWELKGDFMSGSFINYAIMDRKNRKFIIIEGFCYAPSTEKRDLMHELEAIIKSVKVLK